MCPVPAALFKDSFMYKTDKSTLANKMLAGVDQSAAGCRPVDHVIIDGGWLIHRLPWKRNVTFDVIVVQHSTYVQKLAHSAQCQVIFDGYSTSIKDHEHTRRSEGKTHCDVLLQRGTVNRYDRDNFFLNTQNKVRFMELLADRLQRDGHTVTTCPGDADITIVKAALQVYAENGSVDVVCTDTDILCMLVHHFQIGTRTSGSIVFRKEPHKGNPKKGGRYSVEETCESLNPAQTEAILFLHCWSGCDTTSGFYGHGKLELFNQVNRSAKLQEIARQMGEFNSPDDIGQLGVQLTSFQYGGGDFGADLTGLRYSKFCEIVAKCSKFDPRVLPPTPRAIHFHSLRSHLQLIRWKHLDDSLLDETGWGWTKTRNGFEPIPTDMAVAPTSVLNFIRCKCKKLKNKCGNNLCSCRKNGLKCMEACAGCHGRDCLNQKKDCLDQDTDASDASTGEEGE